MGARLINNERSRNLGCVQDAPRLDIRELRRSGSLREGALSLHNGPAGEIILADLQDIENASLFILIEDLRQRIPLIFRNAPFGGRRWFMLDEYRRPCEVLYRSGAVFASRTGAGLTYRSQSLGGLDRLIAERDAIKGKLAGGAGKGAARGRNRRQLQSHLAELEQFFELYGEGLAKQHQIKRTNAKARAARSQERLQKARAQIERRRTIGSEEVIGRYAHLLSAPDSKGPKIDLKYISEDDGEVRPRELSLRFLDRLGYLQPGKLTGHQIGWPQKWLGKGCRLFMLFDLRARSRWRAIVVFECGRQATAQYFRVVKIPGQFGKTNYVFEDLIKGMRTGRLVFKRGVMQMVDADAFKSEPGPGSFNRLSIDS